MVLNSPTLPAPRRLFHTAKKKKKKEKKSSSRSRGHFYNRSISLKISERLDHQQRVSESFIHFKNKKKLKKNLKK